MSSRILANLDCEAAFARLDARIRRDRGGDAPPAGDPGFSLPPRTLQVLSALGTLLRAMAREGDRIWTLLPVDPARMADVPGLPLPVLESGPLEELEPAGKVHAWGETEAAARERSRAAGKAAEGAGLPPPAAIFREAAVPDPAAAARANHKGLALRIAESLGIALPGARAFIEIDALEAHIGSGGGAASRAGRWVIKAPFSASGNLRVRGAGRELDPRARRGAERLLRLYGEVIFEPWMERQGDQGASAVVEGGSVRLLGLHRLEVSAAGVFRGIVIPPAADPRGFPGEAKRVEEVTAAAGKALAEVGYSGFFGVDSWTYTDLEGRRVLHPLGEINARMTFGILAAALVERLRGSGVIPPDATATFVVGKVPPAGAGPVIPLLLPGGEDTTGAWLEADSGPL